MVSSTKLTDDILIEIFAYLPLGSIYRFRSVSKVWLSNLSHPNFITKWFKINSRSLPWMLYYAMVDYSTDGNPLRFKMAYPDLHSEFLSRNERLFSFKFLLNQIQFEDSKLYLLGSSSGLVLSYSFGSDNRTRYHVCNPLTQKWVSLPSPPRSQASHLDVNGIFIIPGKLL
ncbi:putative F-box protein At1g47300 [Papaver somniferum]|uniref:putative F-box protein At1g47300 n=1 Tax=Papaver somniferum TaxID=3469 RepID=UPI000E7033FF|nr:putative F-box protein At1g47300 [Papaver somniferum]